MPSFSLSFHSGCKCAQHTTTGWLKICGKDNTTKNPKWISGSRRFLHIVCGLLYSLFTHPTRQVGSLPLANSVIGIGRSVTCSYFFCTQTVQNTFTKWLKEVLNQKQLIVRPNKRCRNYRISCRVLCVWRSTANPEYCPVCTSSVRPVWRNWWEQGGTKRLLRAPTAANQPLSPREACPVYPLLSTSSTFSR